MERLSGRVTRLGSRRCVACRHHGVWKGALTNVTVCLLPKLIRSDWRVERAVVRIHRWELHGASCNATVTLCFMRFDSDNLAYMLKMR